VYAYVYAPRAGRTMFSDRRFLIGSIGILVVLAVVMVLGWPR
jgi:hypothetical protein